MKCQSNTLCTESAAVDAGASEQSEIWLGLVCSHFSHFWIKYVGENRCHFHAIFKSYVPFQSYSWLYIKYIHTYCPCTYKLCIGGKKRSWRKTWMQFRLWRLLTNYEWKYQHFSKNCESIFINIWRLQQLMSTHCGQLKKRSSEMALVYSMLK